MSRRLPAPLTAVVTLTATAVAGLVLTASSAGATQATFTLSAGGISVSQPTATATLSGDALGLSGTVMTGSLGTTTITDERGALLGGLTVKMSSTPFAHAGGTYEIPATAVTGWSGVVTPSGVAVPVGTTQAMPVSLSALGGGTIVTVTGITGAATLTYDPTVSVAVPAGAPAGTYTGTITQTAS